MGLMLVLSSPLPIWVKSSYLKVLEFGAWALPRSRQVEFGILIVVFPILLIIAIPSSIVKGHRETEKLYHDNGLIILLRNPGCKAAKTC